MDGIKCIAALKALGELNRLRIVRLLLRQQSGVNAIAAELEISQYNVSKHLRILKEAGLVEVKRQGRQRLYAIKPAYQERLKIRKNVLDLGCCSFQLDKLPR